MTRPRLLAALGAIVLAIIGTIGMVAYVSGAEERAASGELLAEVFVVNRRIPAGTEAAALPSFTSHDTVPQKLVTRDTVGDLADLEGLVAEVELHTGEILLVTRFVEPQVFEREVDRVIERPAGMQEVTIALEPERAVGGLLVPGDTAGLIISFNPFDVESDIPVVIDDGILPPDSKTNTTSYQTLHHVLVTNVQLEKVPEVAEREGIEDEEDRKIRLVPSGKLLVTFAVDVPTAERIVFGAEFGTIWLTNEPLDTDQGGSQIQNRGTIYVGPEIETVDQLAVDDGAQ